MRGVYTHFNEEDFGPGLLDATRRFFAAGPWDGGRDEKLSKFTDWLVEASAAVVVDPPKLKIVPPDECGVYGGYVPLAKTIYLPKFSVTTLFFAFRAHYLVVTETLPTSPLDGHAWATSLYAIVDPDGFRQSVMDGRILSVQPEDLEELA